MRGPSLLFSLFLMSAGAQAGIEIAEGQVRAMPPSVPNTAGYLELTSHGQDDALLAARCDGVKKTELHTILVEEGITKMREVKRIELAADTKVALTEGGYHLMMMGLEQPLNVGDTVRCQLTFENAAAQDFELTVKDMVSAESHHHHHHHH